MKVSVGGFSFNQAFLNGTMDVFGYLETVRYRYGLATVDLWNGQFADRSHPLLKLPDREYLKKIRQAMDEKEMTLVNIAIDGAHLWDPDADKREALHKNALEYLDASILLGAKTVRIDTGGRGQSTFSEEELDYVAGRYREYCQIAQENGFTIGPENHMGPSLVPGEMKRLAEAVNHPSYGFLLHMHRWDQDREQGDAIVAPWTVHTHFDPQTAEADDAVETIRMLKKNGYDGYWGVEHHAQKQPYLEVEWLLTTVKHLLLMSEDDNNGEEQA
ncbi:sugar phosphate isomerase/epimerase family protein [Paenibacillus chitinolyticus]|uniref:sugar phosphate isomerase/epimerase family protein n=1 Tax=Paenibacillus chitinolyticus TaxID=79263 RepID=UPI001C474E71|nr:TIM barrel protein [Paenibacillus chitinolyticus]MBV6714042.1 sugar phosphate isomerase/epimerase [Paenibacillus chitinolyticus]